MGGSLYRISKCLAAKLRCITSNQKSAVVAGAVYSSLPNIERVLKWMRIHNLLVFHKSIAITTENVQMISIP